MYSKRASISRCLGVFLFLLLFLVYPLLFWGASAHDFVVLEPLITPKFLTKTNPVIMNSLNQTLADLDFTIPPQEIPLWLMNPIHVNIKPFKVKDIHWTDVSGLYLTEDALGFRAVMDMVIDADYETNSYVFLNCI